MRVAVRTPWRLYCGLPVETYVASRGLRRGVRGFIAVPHRFPIHAGFKDYLVIVNINTQLHLTLQVFTGYDINQNE